MIHVFLCKKTPKNTTFYSCVNFASQHDFTQKPQKKCTFSEISGISVFFARQQGIPFFGKGENFRKFRICRNFAEKNAKKRNFCDARSFDTPKNAKFLQIFAISLICKKKHGCKISGLTRFHCFCGCEKHRFLHFFLSQTFFWKNMLNRCPVAPNHSKNTTQIFAKKSGGFCTFSRNYNGRIFLQVNLSHLQNRRISFLSKAIHFSQKIDFAISRTKTGLSSAK